MILIVNIDLSSVNLFLKTNDIGMLKMILLFYRPKEITLEPTHMSFWINRESSSTQTGPGTEGTFPPPPTRPDLTVLVSCVWRGWDIEGEGQGAISPTT